MCTNSSAITHQCCIAHWETNMDVDQAAFVSLLLNGLAVPINSRISLEPHAHITTTAMSRPNDFFDLIINHLSKIVPPKILRFRWAWVRLSTHVPTKGIRDAQQRAVVRVCNYLRNAPCTRTWIRWHSGANSVLFVISSNINWIFETKPPIPEFGTQNICQYIDIVPDKVKTGSVTFSSYIASGFFLAKFHIHSFKINCSVKNYTE